jgi:septal ring factor EnvC (AmiA/AmiB activator)
MNITTQTILAAKTCAQLSAMMEELKVLQALIINQYEGIAMNEQQEIALLEDNIEEVKEVEEILYNARFACNMVKDTVKSGEYEKVDIKQEYDILETFINALKQFSHHDQAVVAVEYMEALQAKLIAIYEGI